MNLVHGRNSQKELHLPDLNATMLGNLPDKLPVIFRSYPGVSDLQN